MEDVMEIRTGTSDDLPFVPEVAALFGRGAGTRAVEGLLGEPNDRLVIGSVDGARVAAAWARQFWLRMGGQPVPHRRALEVYVGVTPTHQNHGYGTDLGRNLIEGIQSVRPRGIDARGYVL